MKFLSILQSVCIFIFYYINLQITLELAEFSVTSNTIPSQSPQWANAQKIWFYVPIRHVEEILTLLLQKKKRILSGKQTPPPSFPNNPQQPETVFLPNDAVVPWALPCKRPLLWVVISKMGMFTHVKNQIILPNTKNCWILVYCIHNAYGYIHTNNTNTHTHTH